MANWDTSVTTSAFNAADPVKNQMGGRNRTNDYWGNSWAESANEVGAYEDAIDVKSDFWQWVTGTTDYSIVGIDGNQITTMTGAIDSYVEGVQTYLAEAIAATEEQIHSAFRGGDAEKAVKEYLEKVKTYVYNLVSTLSAFSDKLRDVGNAWVKAQSEMGSNVKSSTGAFSEGSAYSSTVQYGGSSQS